MYLNSTRFVIFSNTHIRNRRNGAYNVFPRRTWGMRRSSRPEFFLNTIMFSFVGTNPPLANVETVRKAENVST
uniref:Uncharacterized protein n=1 Tax=Rhizophora mucronata TaxID=61149 RepID=A0A2P2PVV0_RHIMU